jgi:hypothetical protein
VRTGLRSGLQRTEGLPIKLIVRTLGISRNTVRSANASGVPDQGRGARPRSVERPWMPSGSQGREFRGYPAPGVCR